jgi:nicotinate-nucleotide--dimethylbenzimidazole phosphoribosyltransferase
VTELIDRTVARIVPADADAAFAARRALDSKTKPRGSLGELEELACRIAGIRHDADPRKLEAAVVVVAADHGVAQERVSAYPPEVTQQMVANFDAGGAAVCVLARLAGASLRVVDAGVGTPTQSIAAGPAMTLPECVGLVERGILLADELARDGAGVVALGEMGIGNSTAAAAVCAALLEVDPALTCGRGTGLDDAGVERKVDVVRRALRANPVDPEDPLGLLAALGGFELAVLAGLVLGGAANRLVLLLDGFITTAAALVAARLCPTAVASMVAAHRSPEPGHTLALEALGLEPLLDLGLRLGEGSGAALALPLLHASLAVLDEMATFESAGVTDAGR